MDVQLLTVDGAAERLGLHPRRVRAMIQGGALEAEKVGGRWLVSAVDVARNAQLSRPRGRPLSSSRAWALVFLIEGRIPTWLSKQEVARTRSYLTRSDVAHLLPRLRRRAELRTFRAHPADVPRVAEEKGVVLSGASAAPGYGASVIAPGTVEGYVAEDTLARLTVKYHLISSSNPNVRLHAIEGAVWPFESDERIAPWTAVGLDLIEADDERSRRAGRELLHERHLA
jgi:excisionase family DNA binding protein